MKLRMYIMGPEAISEGELHKSFSSICTFVARQRLDRHVSAATNTRNSRRIVGCVVVYTVRVVKLSKAIPETGYGGP
jgi:hypothetical protein